MSNAVKALQAVRVAALAALLGMPAQAAVAQENAITMPLNDAALVQPRHVTVKAARYRGSDALEVRQTGPYRGFDTDTFAFVPGLDFHDGTIEVDVAGSSLPDAPANARGFVGIAFRIDEQGGTFACEGLYIRPSNGRASDQLRRNRSTQYFSIPAMISTACGAKPRASTNPTSTSRSANGRICGSRSPARRRSSMSAAPRSLR